jgi:hypothetical protein
MNGQCTNKQQSILQWSSSVSNPDQVPITGRHRINDVNKQSHETERIENENQKEIQ